MSARMSPSLSLHCAAVATTGLFLTSCTTVSVSRAAVDGSGSGLRYCLPKPLMVVKPLPEGGYEVAFVNVPDPAFEYCVDTTAFLAHQDLAIETAGGLLAKVTQKSYDPEVAKQVVADAGAFAVEKVKERQAKQAAAAADAAERDTERADLRGRVQEAITAVDTAAADVRAKTNARNEAQIALDGFKTVHGDNPTDPQQMELAAAVRKASFDLDEANQVHAAAVAKHDRLLAQLDKLRRQTAAGNAPAMAAPVGGKTLAPNFASGARLAPSWKILAIQQSTGPMPLSLEPISISWPDGTEVGLVAGQTYAAIKPQPAPTVPSPQPKEAAKTASAEMIGDVYVVTVPYSQPFGDKDTVRVADDATGTHAAVLTRDGAPDTSGFSVTKAGISLRLLKKDFPPGRYTIDIRSPAVAKAIFGKNQFTVDLKGN